MTDAPKFTPGPWRVMEPAALDYRAPRVYGADQESLVASAEGGGPKRAIAGAEARANAFLIAAAPELYEALEAVRPYFEGEHHPDHPHCRQMRAALAKARGESVL